MQELEAKYLVTAGSDGAQALRRLQQSLAWAGYRIQPSGRRRVIDTYLDTADQQLRHAGWSYRRRQQNGNVTLALKELNRSRAAVFDREEIEQPLYGGDADAAAPPAGIVRDRLAGLLQPEARLEPVFALHNQRTRFLISHPDHPRAVVELSYDRARLGASSPVAFTEIEFELTRGPHEMLASLLDVAALEPELVAARLSKYQRGLLAAGCPLERRRAPQARHLNAESRWLDLAVAHLKSQFYLLKLYEPYAWEGVHPEGVHQMRVASRRTRAALGLFRDVLPAVEAARLADHLRRLHQRLGAVRDLDVHLAHLGDYDRVFERGQRPALAGYRAHLVAQHRRARARLLDTLDDETYAALVADFRQLLTAAGRPEHAVEAQVAASARQALGLLLAKVQRRGRAIDAKSPARQLHRLRIQAKRLRYALEFVEDVYGQVLARPLEALRSLQDELGLFQDATVARSRLSAFRGAHDLGKRQRRLLKRLIAFEKQRARKARRRITKLWRRVDAATTGLLDQL